MKEPAINGFENDVLSGWRRVLKYTRKAGVCKKAKRSVNRRARIKGRMDVRAQEPDTDSHF